MVLVLLDVIHEGGKFFGFRQCLGELNDGRDVLDGIVRRQPTMPQLPELVGQLRCVIQAWEAFVDRN